MRQAKDNKKAPRWGSGWATMKEGRGLSANTRRARRVVAGGGRNPGHVQPARTSIAHEPGQHHPTISCRPLVAWRYEQASEAGAGARVDMLGRGVAAWWPAQLEGSAFWCWALRELSRQCLVPLPLNQSDSAPRYGASHSCLSGPWRTGKEEATVPELLGGPKH